jgi:CubicO group peptidase (beta-lactamase class C family)
MHAQLTRVSARVLTVAFAVGAAAPSAQSQAVNPCTARWEGAITLPTGALAFDVDLRRAANNVCAGDISIPAQGVRDVALLNVLASTDSLRFTISGVPGNPTFAAVRMSGARTVDGTFTQGGARFPFKMSIGASPAEQARAALATFGPWIDSTLTKWHAPGLSIGITVDGETVYLAGHGMRDRERKLPVTEKTLFAIGSSSKAFTTFAMGALVDNGTMQWDTPLRTYLPWFRMHDDFATLRITPRDLVTHRSGLPRHDLLWYNNNSSTREELVRRIAYLPLSRDLRTTFQYNNLMFLTAGFLVGELTNSTWEAGLQQLVLDPLGMTRTNFSVKQSQLDADHALPYRTNGDTITRIPFRDISLVGPAGSINSSAEDMLRWLNLHLSGGKRGETQVIQSNTLRDMYRPYTPITGLGNDPELGPQSYALGWFVDTYRGQYRVQHGGNIDGFTAAVQMLPTKRIGIVVLVNQNGSALGELISRHAMDRLLGGDTRDWSGEGITRRDAALLAARSAPKLETVARVANTKPMHTLSQYVGAYADSGYGTLNITMERDTLRATYNGISALLAHWHYETFNGLRNPDDPTFENQKVTFRTSNAGRVDALQVVLDANVPPVTFLKQADARLRETAYLQSFVGRYNNPALQIELVLRNNTLVWLQAGTPTEMEPLETDRFTIKGVQGAVVEFVRDTNGRITSLRAIQPGGVAVFTRN